MICRWALRRGRFDSSINVDEDVLDLTAEKARIFRITHIDNVDWVLANGLHCKPRHESCGAATSVKAFPSWPGFIIKGGGSKAHQPDWIPVELCRVCRLGSGTVAWKAQWRFPQVLGRRTDRAAHRLHRPSFLRC